MSDEPAFDKLFNFIERLPAIDLPTGRKSIGNGYFENGNWWIKLHFDLKPPLAWRHVHELGHCQSSFRQRSSSHSLHVGVSTFTTLTVVLNYFLGLSNLIHSISPQTRARSGAKGFCIGPWKTLISGTLL